MPKKAVLGNGDARKARHSPCLRPSLSPLESCVWLGFDFIFFFSGKLIVKSHFVLQSLAGHVRGNQRQQGRKPRKLREQARSGESHTWNQVLSLKGVFLP